MFLPDLGCGARLRLVLGAILMSVALAGAGPASAPAAGATAGGEPEAGRLSPAWNAILGDWRGEGGGAPGAGTGTASFRFDLDRHVIIRRGTSDYPAAGGRPATHHEDLTIIYPGPSGGAASAVYFDNEGHTIEYSATWSADGKSLVFLSPASQQAPRFRLTYTLLAPDTMELSFEIAPPGGGELEKYVGGVMKRIAAE
jgi:hypothetical protein